MILIPLAEVPGGPMSAPALRRFEIGRALSDEFEVVFGLSRPVPDDVDVGSARCVQIRNRRELSAWLSKADVLYTLGIQPGDYSLIARSGVRVMLDLYVPRAFEVLESSPNADESVVQAEYRRDVGWAGSSIRLADFLICTNAAQRDFWIGFMISGGLLDVAATRASPDLSRRICVVPHGVTDGQFARGAEGDGPGPLRAKLGLSRDDFVLLWSSRILAWQDPVLLMQAMSKLAEVDPKVRLVLLGVGQLPRETDRHLDGHAFRTLEAVRAAEKTGLVGKNIFFVEERIPHQDLGDYYRDCDLAVGTYPASLETHYCLATRFLDYVAADLPFVVSGTSAQQTLIDMTGGGRLVQPHNEDQLVEAILEMRSEAVRSTYTEQLRSSRSTLAWRNIVEPIRDYCRSADSSRRPSMSGLQCLKQVAAFYWQHGMYRIRKALNQNRDTRD